MKQVHLISLDHYVSLPVIRSKDEKELNELELDKEMSTNDIEKIGKILKDKLTYSLLLLDNSHYNQYVKEGQKLSCIKAKLYNQAMINVIQRIEHPISKVTIDDFLAPKKYYRYLKSKIVVVRHIEFKKEEMSLAMKCAHILFSMLIFNIIKTCVNH